MKNLCKKNLVIVFLITVLVSMSVFTATTNAATTSSSSENLLSNGDFEKVSGTMPADWAFSDSNSSETTVSYVKGQGINGSGCIKFSSTSKSDRRAYQNVKLEANQTYILTGYVKTENIQIAENGEIGANICIYPGYTYSSYQMDSEYSGWKKLRLIFTTDNEGSNEICCRLGHWFNTTSGTAYFDNMALKKYQASNELVNGNFENKEYLDSYGWQFRSNKTSSTIKVANNSGINNSACMSISASELSDNSCFQNLKLKPYTAYVFSGYVKGDSSVVVNSNNGGLGANLALTSRFARTTKFENDGKYYGWKKMTLNFATGNTGDVQLACKLGGNARGTIYFDNLTLQEDTSIIKTEGNHVIMMFKESDYKNIVSDAGFKTWISNMDKVYEAYLELVGKAPYGGAKIAIYSDPEIAYGAAYAGNPIMYGRSGIAESMANVAKYADWVFGAMHELSHDFDEDKGEQWNFNGELMANFKMCYAMEKLNATFVRKIENNINRVEIYTGKDAETYYKSDAGTNGDISYDKTIGAKVGCHHDALTYCLLRTKNQVGWATFRVAFHNYQNSDIGNKTNLEKFDLFLDNLQKAFNPAGSDIKNSFPAGELDYIRSFNIGDI